MVIVKEFRANDRTANQQQYNARPETAAESGMLLVVEIEGFEPLTPLLAKQVLSQLSYIPMMAGRARR